MNTMTRLSLLSLKLLLIVSIILLPAGAAELAQRQSRSAIHAPDSLPDLSAVLPDVIVPGVRDVTLPLLDPHPDVQPRSSWFYADYPHEITVANITLRPRYDDDGDGYYHGFELRLDVDVDGAVEWIYLKLYVSYQGGPWRIVHRSGDIHLSWSLFSNEIALTTLLDSGYPRGYYDLRVDLFDADTGRWLLSLGPYDAADLSAVALEDRGRDRDVMVGDGSLSYGVGVYGTGAIGVWPLLLLALLFLIRR